MGEIKTVRCKKCKTEWEIPIGPAVMTPLDTIYTCRCNKCGKEVKMTLAESYKDDFCECGGWMEIVADEEFRHCPKCGSGDYDEKMVMLVD